MAYESIKVDIIPGAENVEVLHFSQYDNKRPFFIELFNGGVEFIPEEGMSLSLECRKRDGNIVILSDPVLIDNVAEFSTTEQLTACYGDNMAEIKIVDDNDLVIGSANFIINVEKSPTCGGLVSESEIDNLTQQIEDIAQEVIGDDYYNKAQTDALLENKANVSDLPDMTDYYTKTQTDDLLYDKVDYDELNQYYKKTEVDNLLNAKVDKTTLQNDYYDADYISSQFARKSFVENYVDVTATASGNPCNFETGKYHTLIPALTADIVCGGGGGTPSRPIPLVGYSELNITRCGVNQFDEQTETGYYDSATGEKKPLASEIRSTNLIPVLPNTNYAKVGLVAGYSFIFFDSAKNFISRYTSGGSTFTTPANCYYIGINFGANYGTTYNNDVSINYPLTDTEYHAYNGQTYAIPFGQTVYGGVLDVTSGKLHVTHKLITHTWSEFGNKTSLGSNTRGSIYITSEGIGIKNNPTDICNVATYNYAFASDTTHFYIDISGDNTALFVFLPNDTSGDLNIQVCYELATPIVIDVDAISPYAEHGINNIISDCIGDVNVSYKDTIQHYIDSRI